MASALVRSKDIYDLMTDVSAGGINKIKPNAPRVREIFSR